MKICIDPITNPTLSLEEAAAVLGIGRSAAYEAAIRGEIPTIKIGRCKRVPTAELCRILGLGPDVLGPVCHLEPETHRASRRPGNAMEVTVEPIK
ncbi:MAG: helix-turn-helix domain-containing protein [Actinobacteria bacterium]|uniref:Unannotated protein n=1 Tax=freshwater metagenome TaxID=449393 RepID=A0A6J6QL65_9ZZZZ|nr:helix-turn-helix domain-containing protein [Actinomycetota bacterium]